MAIIKKAFVLSLTLCLALATLGLAGCGNSPEQLIKDALSQSLDLNNEMNSTSIADATKQLTDNGLDGEAIVAAWFEGYGYEIGTVTINENTATASVTVTCKQLGPAYDACYEDLMSQAMTDSAMASMSADEIMAKFSEMIVTALGEATPVATPVEFNFTLDGNTWSIADAQTTLQQALYGESENLNL
jgi:hypothetical protein